MLCTSVLHLLGMLTLFCVAHVLLSSHTFTLLPIFLVTYLVACLKVKLLSHVQLLATPRTEADQVPPSMGFSRQEYWSGLPFPS